MKKSIPLIALLFCLFANGQYVDRSFLRAGFHGAAALGDAADISSFGLGLDIYQHWGVSKEVDVGIATGVQYYFGSDSTVDIGPEVVTTRGEDSMYLPVAALFRIYPTRSINLGADVGYAIGINEFTESGFYYRPTLAINLSDTSALNFSYLGINSDLLNWSAVTAGAIFQF